MMMSLGCEREGKQVLIEDGIWYKVSVVFMTYWQQPTAIHSEHININEPASDCVYTTTHNEKKIVHNQRCSSSLALRLCIKYEVSQSRWY